MRVTSTPTACQACGGKRFDAFIDLGEVPRSGTFLADAGSPCATVALGFEFCRECVLIRQRKGRTTQADYTEVARRTRRQLPDYAGQIVSTLLSVMQKPPTDLVIEVGANDGTFLNCLREAGFKNLLAIEPSRPLAKICQDAGYAVENIHLTEQDAHRIIARYGSARAVVCRHTLEHVPDPYALLCAMRVLLAGEGCLFLEVPAAAPIVDRLFGHELWDEHLTYFSPANLESMAISAGFRMTEQQAVVHRSSENLLFWARATETGTIVPSLLRSAPQELVARCGAFSARWTAFRAHMRGLADMWRTPVFALGASHPQSNFLLFSGLGTLLDGLVDEDPAKLGRYVPLPRPTPVLSADALPKKLWGGTLLLTAFGYHDWMQQIRSQLSAAAVEFVDPLEHLHQF